jgi:hypothetical protein
MKLAGRYEHEISAGEIASQGLDQEVRQAHTRPIEECRRGVKTGLRAATQRKPA